MRTCRNYGTDTVVLALNEIRLPLGWRGINAYLEARTKERQVAEYAYDLIWMLVRAQYDQFTAPMPSELRRPEKRDERTAEQIKNDLLRKLSA